MEVRLPFYPELNFRSNPSAEFLLFTTVPGPSVGSSSWYDAEGGASEESTEKVQN
jgi:hypothetical protein